mgnify:CR=1 FL=1
MAAQCLLKNTSAGIVPCGGCGNATNVLEKELKVNSSKCWNRTDTDGL